jgi:sugar/nucleoside kinase (ribokinase family)
MVAESPDVIGFGAMNVDYIASVSTLSGKIADIVGESTARFEWGAEGAAEEGAIRQAMERIGQESFTASLGGSAWLSVYSLAHMKVGLRIGYVGYAGRVAAPGLSFVREMDRLGIDRRFVGYNPARACGMCLSYVEDGERVMRTYPGANADLADYLDANLEKIAEYFASARYLHVTSFLDERTPAAAHRTIRRAKELNPGLIVLCDPGHAWSIAPSPAVEGILGLADYLLVNHREFKSLGGYMAGEPDEAVAQKIYDRYPAASVIVVTKRYDLAEVFELSRSGLLSHRFLERFLEEGDVTVEDATGAGDTFSAGVLAALASWRLHVELGSYLGMSLARRKVRRRPLRDMSSFSYVARGFLQTRDPVDDAELPPGVFLSHGLDPQWRRLRRFLEDECRVPVYTLETAPEDPVAAMRRMLALCSFAICLLTAEDVMQAGGAQADQNVVHQAGLFQGRYGFSRVLLLVEAGVEPVSNVSGLVALSFRRGLVDSTFWQITRLLRREGLMSDD